MKKMGLFFVIMAILALVLVACSSGSDAAAEPTAPPPPTATAIANVPDQPEASESEETSAEPPEAPDVKTSKEVFDVTAMTENLGDYVLRPENMPNDYNIVENGELHLTNSRIINTMGEVNAKRYIADTSRVDGWSLELQRVKKEELLPYTFVTQVEVFETSEGAANAFSEDWLPVYQESEDENAPVPTWIDNGCDLGDACIMYYYEKLDPATELTTLQYEIVFVYRNVVGKIMARGIDYDMNVDYFEQMAQIFFDKIDAAPLAE
jgi:hypothetical protein